MNLKLFQSEIEDKIPEPFADYENVKKLGGGSIASFPTLPNAIFPIHNITF